MTALSDNSRTILEARYLDGESVESLWDRASLGNPDYREMISNLLMLPNSPTLFNAGKGNGCTLSACFVFDVDDTMLDGPRSIMGTAAKAAAVAKAGGGVGYYFGNVRPKNAVIKSVHRKACGPVAVLRYYHQIRNLITQGGKRDLAQMGVLPVWHPDVREFIHCKDEDPQALASFNISVSWNDEWINKVDWDFLSQLGGDGLTRLPESQETALWGEQCLSAWRTGDPGMLFHDTINEWNATPHVGTINATNPCFTGDQKVWTIYGPQRFDELVGKEVPVLSQDKKGNLVFKVMRDIRMTGEGQKVYRVKTVARRGRGGRRLEHGEFIATANHKVFLSTGEQVEVRELSGGDRLSSVYRFKSNKTRSGLRNTAGDCDLEYKIIASYAHGSRPEYPEFHVHHKDDNCNNNRPENLQVLPGKEHDALKMRGANNPMNRFPEKNPFTLGKFKSRGFKGRKHTEESKAKIRKSCVANNHEVVSVEYVGREDVYCGSVERTHKFFLHTEADGGVLVHNCGETPNLCDEPCNLGSLALRRYLIKDGPGKFRIDWAKLIHYVRLATSYLDAILDVNQFPHPDIDYMARHTRKLGLGVMGWADMLALLHIPYDCNEAVDLADELMGLIARESLDQSIALGQLKGLYPAYDKDKSPEWAPACRNSTRTSIAPTGTIAIIADNSSSIEPHYALENSRVTGEGIRMQEKITVWDDLNGFIPKVANEIALEWHIKHQAAFQKHTDLGVSKTINLPNNATVKDVSNAYRMMWETKCKGGTIYRDGCRAEQVLVAKKTASVFSTGATLPTIVQPTPVRKKLPDDSEHTIRHKFKIDGIKGYLHIGLYDDGTPGEIFLRFSKSGSTVSGILNAWAMTFSNALQYGTPLKDLIRLHKGQRFEPNGMTGNKLIPTCSSIPDYIVRFMEMRFLGESTPKPVQGGDYAVQQTVASLASGHVCPDCGTMTISQAGCLMCVKSGCGWSRCG